jgi:homoserine O-acetyltransferase
MTKRSTIYNHIGNLELEVGGYLVDPTIKYTTYGSRAPDDSNVVWVLHALTANDDPMEWWPDIVGPGCPIDTDRYYVICASMLGGHYGSTNPLSIDPVTGHPYFDTFPILTNRDIVAGFDLLRRHLGIQQIHCIIGSSLGGQQAVEWLVQYPQLVERAVLIATNAVHSPWGIAFNESQRMAIEADQTYGDDRADAGETGLAAARSIALLSYRTAEGYNQTQSSTDDGLGDQRASSYQRYQGAKLVRRYNAYSYYRLTQAMDSHHVGRARGGVEQALGQIKAETSVVGITSDIIFPIAEQYRLCEHIPNSTMYEIQSALGHDGFLVEREQMSSILRRTLRQATAASL